MNNLEEDILPLSAPKRLHINNAYFEVKDYYSNSFLTMIRNAVIGKEPPSEMANFFKFGKDYEDELLYAVDSGNPVINAMVRATRKNSMFQSLIYHPEIKIQHEYYGKFHELPFKIKSDLSVKRHIVADIKSTACTNIQSFTDAALQYDYDRQMYVYMNMAKCDKAVLIATTKSKNPKVFVVPINKDDYLYNSGKAKTENIISLIKSL